MLKRCGKCSELKTLDAFYRNGRAGYCIDCEKAYKREHYLKNAERIKAKTRGWAAENKDRKRATDKAYNEANREVMRPKRRAYQQAHWHEQLARSRKSRAANLETYREREAAYRERNRQACNARIKEWKARNPHAVVAHAGKRRAAELMAVPGWADLAAVAEVYRQARALGRSVDHIVPLISPMVCGLHCEANLQLLTISENSRKNNRVWPDMWEAEWTTAKRSSPSLAQPTSTSLFGST